ncbi:hypothetical protein V1509DRAFT_636732, partial [Lipomyces kononenkoae]
PTTFDEFIRACHIFLSRKVQVGDLSHCTKGSLTKPNGRLCPKKFRIWTDCLDSQQQVYNSVRRFLKASEEDAPRLFSSVDSLEYEGRKHCSKPLTSEQDLVWFERLAVEDNVLSVIAELCHIPEAHKHFKLKDGVQFESHSNALTVDSDKPDVGDQSAIRKPVPDNFFYRMDSNTNSLCATVEYKPPHKLSVESLRAGLRRIDSYEKVVQAATTPTDSDEKAGYNAEQLTGSALVQQYNVMILKGLEYSYITTGLALVLLRVRSDDPSTLYYCLCEPNREVDLADDQSFEQPRTAIARVLCLCLMSLLSQPRDQDWRNNAARQLHRLEPAVGVTLAQISEEEPQNVSPDSESQGSEYLLSSTSESVASDVSQPNTRSQTGCRPQETMDRSESMDSSDSDSSESDPNQATSRRQRNVNQSTLSPPPTQRWSSHSSSQGDRGDRRQHHEAKFCTQRCLRGLQRGDILDSHCPNVELHRQGRDSNRHLISSQGLVQLLKEQLDETLNYNIRPFGVCGSYGAPFKITCVPYCYTVVGKGTTSELWKEVSREVEVYRILQRAQGSAVPVFLGAIDLERIYFHDEGLIQHMLLMAWGGRDTTELEHSQALLHEIERSRKEIRALGVVHGDFRYENILWNEELGRALIIDFHRATLAPRLME